MGVQNQEVYKFLMTNLYIPTTAEKENFLDLVQIYLEEFFVNKRKVFNVIPK
jgi:hypothetical protein